MASASSSVLAQGANRSSVGRHATLQPVSSLRVKPFSTAKQSKGRANPASVVGVRNVQRNNNSSVRKPWPLYAAETDPAVEEEDPLGEDAADEDDDGAEYDLDNEEFETEEAEAVVELSDEQIEDRAFLTRQISQLSDEASGETITTAEEDAAAADAEEGVRQLADAVLKIETMSQKAEAGMVDDYDALLENPLPFSDENLYDDIYETLGKMDAVSQATGLVEKDAFDYMVLEAASESTPMPGSYPSEVLDKYDSVAVEEITFTEEEKAIMAAAQARSVKNDFDLPRGIDAVLDLVQAESEPLSADELAMLEAAGEGEVSTEDKQDFAAALEIAELAAGLPAPIDLTTSGLYVLSQLTDAAKATSGADFAAAAQAVLADAKSSGSVSAAEFEQLSAVASGMSSHTLSLPTELFEAYDEKLQEVQATGTISEPAPVEDAATLEAQVKEVLSSNASALGSEFQSIEALLAGVKAPQANLDARAQFFDSARALVGDAEFQTLLEESIAASHDPTQVAAARSWFLTAARDVVSPEELTALSLVVASPAAKPNQDVVPLPQIETAAKVEAFLNDPATEEGVAAAFDILEKAPEVPVDYSLYIRDKENPVFVEYSRLKAEVLAATGVDLDNVKVANKGVDTTMLQVVAQVLMNAAEGKDLNNDLDKIEIPDEAPMVPPGTPLPAELADIQQQLEAAWANQDISPEAPHVVAEQAGEVDMSVVEEDADDDLDASAGFVALEDDDEFFSDEAAPIDPLAALGEVDAADEAKWLQINDEDYAAAVEDVFGDFGADDVSPEVALARAEAALQQFSSSGPAEEMSQKDLALLQTVVQSIVELQASADTQFSKLKQASALVKLAQENTRVLEQAIATAGLYPNIIVPDNMTKDQAAQFVQAYGNQIIASLKAAEQKVADGVHVNSLAAALAQPVLKASEIDGDSIESDLKALAKQVLSADEIAQIESETSADYASDDDIVETEETEEQLAEKYTATELVDLKARATVKGAQLPSEVAEMLVAAPSAEEEIEAVLAELGIAKAPEAEAAPVDVDAVAIAEVQARAAEAAPAGEVDELAFAFSELLNDIVDEVKESAEDALYVEDAIMYEDDAAEEKLVEDEDEEGVDVMEDELEVEGDYDADEAEAQALLEEVLEGFAAKGKAEEEDDDVEVEETVEDVLAADGANDDDDGEAELQTMYNTTETQLLFDDYEDVWEAMGIPEARPKVPTPPRAKETDGEDEEAEESEEAYEEEEETTDADEQEADVADVIAQYYAPDALDDGEDLLEPALAAPKTTLDLFGSAPYLENDEDRAADDTSGLLERVTVSKTGDIFVERIIEVKRVTKVVKGGKIMSFRCVAIVGNRNGIVGVGVGSAREVVQAVQKACQDAKSSLIAVPLTKFDSTPHRVETKFKGSKVVINPAADGTGCIAGGAVRSVLELAGVKNCLAKRIGSRNPLNNARATIKALEMLQTWGEVAAKRGLPISYLFARDEASANKALAAADEE